MTQVIMSGREPKYIYIAGPLCKGDVAVNVRNAILAADTLLSFEYAVFLPHLTHFWHLVLPNEYEDWLRLDLAWLEKCDCLIRLPGESSGADREAARARELGLPVFDGVEAFLKEVSRES